MAVDFDPVVAGAVVVPAVGVQAQTLAAVEHS